MFLDAGKFGSVPLVSQKTTIRSRLRRFAKLPRRAGAHGLTEDQTPIERANVNPLPLQNTFADAEIDSPRGAGFVAVRERPLDPFAAFLQQLLSIFALHPATVRVDRLLLVRLARPLAPLALQLRNLGQRFQTDLRFPRGRFLRFPLYPVGQIPGRLGQRFPNRCGVTLVGRRQRHRDPSAALHVHGVLGLVRPMRGSVLHLRHPRIRVTGTYPLPMGSLLLSFPVDAGQVFPCGSLNPDCRASPVRNSS